MPEDMRSQQNLDPSRFDEYNWGNHWAPAAGAVGRVIDGCCIEVNYERLYFPSSEISPIETCARSSYLPSP